MVDDLLQGRSNRRDRSSNIGWIMYESPSNAQMGHGGKEGYMRGYPWNGALVLHDKLC